MVNSSAPLKSLSWSKINGIITSGASKGGGGGGGVVNPGYPVPPATPGIPTGTTATAINAVAKTVTISQNPTISTASANVVYGSVGGQSIIAVMRQGQNNASLNEAGVLTQSDVPLIPNPAPTKAALIPSKYTVAEALTQIKI